MGGSAFLLTHSSCPSPTAFFFFCFWMCISYTWYFLLYIRFLATYCFSLFLYGFVFWVSGFDLKLFSCIERKKSLSLTLLQWFLVQGAFDQKSVCESQLKGCNWHIGVRGLGCCQLFQNAQRPQQQELASFRCQLCHGMKSKLLRIVIPSELGFNLPLIFIHDKPFWNTTKLQSSSVLLLH